MTQKLQKEVAAGRMAGPFDIPPFDNFHTSPLAVVEKKKKGSYRLIQNLSYPEGESVNDEIPKARGTVKYQNLDNAIDSILQLGPGCILSKSDVEHAFKVIPVAVDDQPKMGIYWESSYWYNKTLAMGCRTSPKIFEAFTTALEWILREKCSIQYVHHILDDFLIVSYPAIAEKQLQIFLALCAYWAFRLWSRRQSQELLSYFWALLWTPLRWKPDFQKRNFKNVAIKFGTFWQSHRQQRWKFNHSRVS